MKKLRSLSTLALTGMLGILGAGAIATSTVSTVNSNNVSTYALECNSDGSIPDGYKTCGDIYAVDGSGMTFVDEEITLMFDIDSGTTDQYVEYVANLRIDISAYEASTNVSLGSWYMKDGYDLDVTIDMPDANDTAVLEGRTDVYTDVPGADDQIGLVLSSGPNSGYYYFDFIAGTNNDFFLQEDTGSENIMNIYKSNSEIQIMILNDPNSDISITTYNVEADTGINPEDGTTTVVDDLGYSWEIENTRVAYKQSFYLQDLDPTIQTNDYPFYYRDLNIELVYDPLDPRYVIGAEISFIVELDGAKYDQFKKSTVSVPQNGDAQMFGHLIIPFTYTWDGKDYWYLYDVNINGGTHDNGLGSEYGYYGEWTMIDEDTYSVQITNALETDTSIDFNGLEGRGIEYQIIDIHPATVDGTGTETLNYHPTENGNSATARNSEPFIRGDLTEEELQRQDMQDGIDNQTVYYNKMWFIPMVYFFPLDADGNVYPDGTGNGNPGTFTPSYFIMASEATVLANVNKADPIDYLVQPWQILLLVWGSTFVTIVTVYTLKKWRDRIEMRGFAFSSKHAKEHAERVRQIDLMLIQTKQAELDKLIHEVEEIDNKLDRSQ